MSKRLTGKTKQVEELAPANRELTGVARRVRNATAAYSLTGSGLAALGNFLFPSGIDYGQGGWGGGWGGNLGTFLSIAPKDFDYSRVNPLESSIVMACLNWISRTFKEAKPGVYKQDDNGQAVIIPNHKLTKLLRRPNPHYSYSKLVGVTLTDYNVNGNAYWFKEKGEGGVGQTQALYFIPSSQITPMRLPGNVTNRFIDYYRYYVNGRVYAIPPDRIIHFRYDLDPSNPMVGRKPLAPVFSEIYGDEQAARYTAALLRNMAIPGVVIVPETDDVDIDDEDAEAMKEDFKRKFGGDNVGEPYIANFRAKVQTIGFDPGKMHLKDLRRIPEERISACLGVAAIVAGLGAGLDRSTYSNFEQAVSHSVESNLVPTWEDFGDELTRQLLPEFTNGEEEVRFDISNVKALRENADALAKRLNMLWLTDVLMRSEIRGRLNLPVEEARDAIFYSDIKRSIAAAGAPRMLPQGDDGDGKRGQAGRMLKAAPRKNLDRAFDYMLEAEVLQAIAEAEVEVNGFLEDLAEEVEKAAEEGVDLSKPEAEAKRIVQKAYEAALDALAVMFVNIGGSVSPGAIRAVSLTLGVTEADAWNKGAGTRFAKVVTQRRVDYGKELREQTEEAAKAAIEALKAGTPLEEIPARIAGYVEGRAMFPGKFQEAFDEAIARGRDEAQATFDGEKAAREYRAKVIAETEARTLQNVAVLDSLGASGMVERVKVSDGDGCGWRNHEDPDKAHNTIRDLKEARKRALAHPHCKRRFFPVPEEAEQGGDQ